ncbi:VanZ family protein [uncultured Lacinutrix sp.]|uniref:VanZ family protein n=1 Tax=uncultured Lacinutrix sp. TaxID=574032 RepID=UPI00260D7428|nr:VanZ family protein [uncultured Lacinutrix sp.]
MDNVVEELPSVNDKVMHALTHFILVVLWFLVFYYRFSFKYYKAIVLAALFSLVYGIAIELLQGYLTISRQSDFKDVLANVLGMVFASILLVSIKKHVLKNNNTLLF